MANVLPMSARRLAKVLAVHGLTVRQIAGAAEVTERTIQNWIDGSTSPTRSTAAHARRAIKALAGQDYSVEWLRGAK